MKLLAQCKEKEKCPEDIPWYIFPTKSKKREIKSRFPEIESWRQILLTTSACGLSFFFSFFVGLFFFFSERCRKYIHSENKDRNSLKVM